MNSINNPGINLLQDLPVPDDSAQEQSRRLGDVIRDEIAENHGRISFRRFMELALYQAGLGYYSGGSRKFGMQGDFTTAPELSPLFSACVARQCEQIFLETGTQTVLELGAGTGIMAADVLTDLQRRNQLPETYMILETSADLRHRQQQLLRNRHPDFFSRITWLDTLPAQPINGIILANEVLDAIPVHRVKIIDNRIHEFMVVADGESFAWKLEPAGSELTEGINRVLAGTDSELPDGYVTEYNSTLSAFIHSLSDSLASGIMLFIDYGCPRHEYYHPQRTDGTLLCHYRHRSHANPFRYIGLQDITAWVDFTQVAESAGSAGLGVTGYTTQSGFLIGCGLDQVITEYSNSDEKLSLRYAGQARQLLLPGEMGENFKAIALARNVDIPLKGFSFINHLHRL